MSIPVRGPHVAKHVVLASEHFLTLWTRYPLAGLPVDGNHVPSQCLPPRVPLPTQVTGVGVDALVPSNVDLPGSSAPESGQAMGASVRLAAARGEHL